MLDGLRIMSKNIFGRVILALFAGLIVVGFGFFGISDMFSNFRTGQLATVGDQEITLAQYKLDYQNALQQIQQRAKRAITNDEARQIGLDRQVLTRLVTGAALDQQARKLDLAISDADIARIIKAEKIFAGPNGLFDQARMDALLRQNGFTEASYVREQRQAALRQQIGAAVTGALKTPEILLSAINIFSNETRKAEFFILPAPSLADAPIPSDDEIAAFHNLRKESYRAPEFRKAVVLIVSPAEVAKNLQLSDEDARKVFSDGASQRFGSPERRAVAQATFPSREAADKAAQRIAAGESFDAVASDKQSGGVLADLGLTSRDAIFDRPIADAAFAPAQPGVSAPVQGAFGWVLVQVSRIEPGQAQDFETVEDRIKAEIAESRARGETQKLHDKIEDLRSSGKTLAQAAEALGLQTRPVTTDASGADKGAAGQPGSPVAALAGAPELVKAIFASDIGVDNDSVARKDGGYSWFEITAIEPSRLPSLEEVRAEAIRALQESKAQKDLAARANELARRIDAGETVAAVAASVGARLEQAVGVRRSGGGGLGEAAVAQIFGVPLGGAGSALADKGARIVFKVTDSVTPPLDLKDPNIAALAPQLEAAVSDDIFAQYLAGLEEQLGTRINQTALRAALGGEQ